MLLYAIYNCLFAYTAQHSSSEPGDGKQGGLLTPTLPASSPLPQAASLSVGQVRQNTLAPG